LEHADQKPAGRRALRVDGGFCFCANGGFSPMRLNLLFTISAVALALYGLAMLLAPAALLYGAVGPSASDALLAGLRTPAGLFIGLALLNGAMHNAEPSKARDAVVLGNAIGFGLTTILHVLAVVGGASAVELVIALISMLLTVAFFAAGRTGMSSMVTGGPRFLSKRRRMYRGKL
jgi:hypothetical protein